MSPRLVLLCVSIVACGAPSAAPRAEPSGAEEVRPLRCEADAECVVGTPEDCCAAHCPEDSVAWTASEWRRYQDECAVEECPALETPACDPERAAQPAAIAVCEAGRCVLARR